MWRFIISAAVTIGLVWLLNVPLTIGSNTLPPLGKFMSTSHGFWQNAERHQFLDYILRLKGVDSDVKVVFDHRLVPHIYADNLRDLYFAQGYVTAMHRLWQLDISTRASAGRIAEVLGDGALDYDKTQRNKGVRKAAQQHLAVWESDSLSAAVIQAYSDGINSYIEKLSPRKYPVEFKLLNYEPEEWEPLKSVYFIRSMANTLCSKEYDLEFSTLRNILGTDTFDIFFPEFNPAQDPIIPKGTRWGIKRRDLPVSDAGDDINVNQPFDGKLKGGVSEEFVGSNNWAVSGAKTASGHPILCNDPHLSLSLPSIWYEVHLSAPGMNTYGASLPGMPCIISGFNEDIAWGETNVGHDMLDWYKIDWTDARKTKYMLDDREIEVDYVVDTIRTKSGREVLDTIKYTYWGPVMNDGPYEGMAMHWIANQKPPQSDATVFLKINRASKPAEFMEALDNYFMPAQNFVYADRDGNIALRIGGALPVRQKEQGRFVTMGDKTANGWTNMVPPNENPYVINPKRGFVSSANQKTTDDTYPYYYTGGKYFEDFRGITLNRYLNALQNADKDDMQQLQHSSFSLKAEQILPLMLAACDSADLSMEASDLIQALRDWDYLYDAKLTQPVYFEEWFNELFVTTWDEVEEFRDSLQITYPEAWRLIDLASNSPDTFAFDITSTPEKETFRDIAIQSLEKVAADLAENPVDNWGVHRPTTIRHLAGLPGFSTILERTSGHGDALNANSSSNGPSWRMIVELDTPVTARVVYPGGQSGNPGSMFYDNMIDEWVDGQYFKAHFPASPSQLDPLFTLTIEKKGK